MKERNFNFEYPCPDQFSPKRLVCNIEVAGVYTDHEDFDIDSIIINGNQMYDVIMMTRLYTEVRETLQAAAESHIIGLIEDIKERNNEDRYDQLAQD